MADQRFRALWSCLVIAWFVGIGEGESNVTEIGKIQVNNSINATMKNETRRKTCVPAHSIPSSEDVCKPYFKGEEGVCSSIIGKRLTYSSKHHRKLESWLKGIKAFRNQISKRCLRILFPVYCNHYFQRCDNTSSEIRPVNICKEACDVMFQQYCREEYLKADEINKGEKVMHFDLINCTKLPRRNGGAIPECYFPTELEENITGKDFTDVCSYGDGRSYRGNVSVTRSGYTCQSWSSQCPHRHHRTPDNFPELKDAGNACRNPGGQAPLSPWCYTTNPSVRWEYCNISTCPPEDATLSEWSPFASCSVSCGSGFKTRYRTCNRSRFGGNDCASFGSLTEQQPCNILNCSGADDILAESEDKAAKELTFTEITIVSVIGAVLLILVARLAVILLKKHKNRNRPKEEEITPYATVRISGIFAFQAEINGHDLPGTLDYPQKALPLQPGTPLEETSTGKRYLQKPPYENIDQLGKSSVNPLKYLFFKPRYENEAVVNESGDVVTIRPGYDKLTPVTKGKEQENGGTHLGRRLPCGMIDKDGLPVYDLLNRKIDLKPESQKADITDSEIENDV